MGKYVDSKVWLKIPGGVVGWELSDLNRKIDKFNAFPWASEVDFFDWLSWEMNDGNDYQGFSLIWNSKLLAKVHFIRR